jgi:hypothetical protein
MAEDTGPLFYTKAPFWENKKAYPFWVLQVLSVFPLTGWFGLDHLYLRSPLTALAKAFVNIFSLGFWYFYDILQFTVDRDTVKEYGASIPFYGPIGVGSGMFLGPGEVVAEESIAPWRYILFALFTLIPLGLDFVVAGDYVGAGLRLFTTISIILWPLGFVWGCINMYRAWLKPADVFEYGTYRIWPFNWFVDVNHSVKGILAPGSAETPEPACKQKGVVESIMEPVTTVVGVAAKAATDVVLEPVATALDGVAAIPAAVAVPLKAAVEQGLAPTVTAGLKVGHLAPAAIAAVPKVAANVSSKLAVMSDPKALAATAAIAAKQVGGGVSGLGGISDAALIFTLSVLVFGGAILTAIRSRDNGPSEENDTPPNPGTVRGSATTKTTN